MLTPQLSTQRAKRRVSHHRGLTREVAKDGSVYNPVVGRQQWYLKQRVAPCRGYGYAVTARRLPPGDTPQTGCRTKPPRSIPPYLEEIPCHRAPYYQACNACHAQLDEEL